MFDDRAWFVYDHDTHTIRLASNPEWVLANQRGAGYKPGKKIVFTQYQVDQPEQYITLTAHKIMNKAHKCLMPSNYETRNKNTLEFWVCSGREVQNWERKEKKPQKTQYGDFDKNMFFLQLRMSGKRRVFMSKVNTLGGFMAKIKQGINNYRAQFIYDKRT